MEKFLHLLLQLARKSFENWCSGDYWCKQNGEVQVYGGDEGSSGRSGRGEDHHHVINVHEVDRVLKTSYVKVKTTLSTYAAPVKGAGGAIKNSIQV